MLDGFGDFPGDGGCGKPAWLLLAEELRRSAQARAAMPAVQAAVDRTLTALAGEGETPNVAWLVAASVVAGDYATGLRHALSAPLRHADVAIGMGLVVAVAVFRLLAAEDGASAAEIDTALGDMGWPT